jgi:hypothetical protein
MAMRILVLGFIRVRKNRGAKFASKLHRTIKVLAGVDKVSILPDRFIHKIWQPKKCIYKITRGIG